MGYRYFICDVFTDTRFGGNPLAVLPDAAGLDARQMQQIAREFNFSETTFVLSPEAGHTRRVRIFTPAQEIPFAGHPNLGTAFALAHAGELGEIDAATAVTFEDAAGVVAVDLRRNEEGVLYCELAAPQRLALGKNAPLGSLAKAVSLDSADFVSATHSPQAASVGLGFVMAELAGREALERAQIHPNGFHALASEGLPPDVYLYTRSGDDFDLRARMFAPLDGVPEDPATGSAACALLGLLSHCDPRPAGTLSLRIAQGVEMGRPSVLEASAEKQEGVVVATRVGGSCVMVSEGTLHMD